jgi:hypothetical protein
MTIHPIRKPLPKGQWIPEPISIYLYLSQEEELSGRASCSHEALGTLALFASLTS